jgi:hypothetical protein
MVSRNEKGVDTMQILVKEFNADGTRIAEVWDGQDYMAWGEYEHGTWTKFYAVVTGQIFVVRNGTWVKRGRGRAKFGTDILIKNLEKHFRNNIKAVA